MYFLVLTIVGNAAHNSRHQEIRLQIFDEKHISQISLFPIFVNSI